MDRELRVCTTCSGLLERRVKQAHDLAAGPSPMLKQYATMMAARDNIDKLLPRFKELFEYLCLREGEAQRAEAVRIRERIIKLFDEYDRLSKYIASFPIPSHLVDPKEGDPQYELEQALSEEKLARRRAARAVRRGQHVRLRAGIRQACQRYLQDNMLTLQMLPPKGKQANVRRHLEQQSEPQERQQQRNQQQQQQQQRQAHGGGGVGGVAGGSSGKKAPAPIPDSERKKIVDVLLEQKTLVEGFIRQAMDEGRNDDLVRTPPPPPSRPNVSATLSSQKHTHPVLVFFFAVGRARWCTRAGVPTEELVGPRARAHGARRTRVNPHTECIGREIKRPGPSWTKVSIRAYIYLWAVPAAATAAVSRFFRTASASSLNRRMHAASSLPSTAMAMCCHRCSVDLGYRPSAASSCFCCACDHSSAATVGALVGTAPEDDVLAAAGCVRASRALDSVPLALGADPALAAAAAAAAADEEEEPAEAEAL